MSDLRHTPLFDRHRALGARLVPFAGFEMPVQYAGIKAEHQAVREAVGLFDVSHMGQLHLAGPGAIATAERLLTCRVDSLAPGCVRYGLLCNDEGGCVDDVTVYRMAEDALMLCVNAANIEKDATWIEDHLGPETTHRNASDETALLALQGPHSRTLLERLAPEGAVFPKRFRFADARLAGCDVIVSTTGYTGAPGFELYTSPDAAPKLWDALLEQGADLGIAPVGLGARDTLRLEAALCLYGHELDDTTSPLEAGLDRFVKRERGGFIGAEAIERREAAGRTRQLMGFVVDGRGIARAEYPIGHEGERVGVVTSGAPSPSLGRSIGLGYVPPGLAALGQHLEVEVRGKPVPIEVVPTPFTPRKSMPKKV